MTDHTKILSLIENVSPDDTAALDEIDARVWCYLNGKEFIAAFFYYENRLGYKFKTDTGSDYQVAVPRLFVTRSRDALKQIRPDGCFSKASPWSWNGREGFQGKAMFFVDRWEERDDDLITNQLPTEELAELHAIIQAIAYIRQDNTGNGGR